MKILKKTVLTLMVFLFGILNVFAAKQEPPAPTRRKPPIPPGFPIDQNISILILIALFLGIYIIYSQRLKIKKTPM